jgi:type VI secretion system protein ImpM
LSNRPLRMTSRCGLFGKLQARRDFIAIETSREFLRVWEPWIQGAVAASRLQLAADWRSAFLTAPIWRFWLGAELCGATMLGATMPSMDAVGRYFPLTLVVTAEAGAHFPPPEFDAQREWFVAAEDLLLATLEAEFHFEELGNRLASLPAPTTLAETPSRSGSGQAHAIVSAAGEHFETTFADARRAAHGIIYATNSFWWTIGGENYQPCALTSLRLPDPHLYAGMLTGKFDTA